MSEQQFAAAVGVSRGAVQQWERPGGTAPRRVNQPRVAELLGLSLAQLMSAGSNALPGVGLRAEVPLVSEVEAGNYTVIDNLEPRRHGKTVTVSVPVLRHTYALRVNGDSMVSDTGDSFPEGSIIVVEPEMASSPGDYVIALLEDGETTFKQLIRREGALFLKPLNVRYPMRPLGAALIVGVVREVSKRFR